MNSNVDWAAEIAAMRRQLKLTTNQLARRLRAHPGQVGAIERGQLLPDGNLERALIQERAARQAPAAACR